MTRKFGKIMAMAVGILLVLGVRSVRLANASVPWPVYDVPRMEAVVIDGEGGDWGDGGFRIDMLKRFGGDDDPAAPAPPSSTW